MCSVYVVYMRLFSATVEVAKTQIFLFFLFAIWTFLLAFFLDVLCLILVPVFSLSCFPFRPRSHKTDLFFLCVFPPFSPPHLSGINNMVTVVKNAKSG